MWKTPINLSILFLSLFLIAASPLSPTDPAVSGYTSSDLNGSYNELLQAFWSEENTSRTLVVSGDTLMIIPWYTQDNQDTNAYLQSGAGCNIGSVAVNTQYCMVTDELSQAGRLFARYFNETIFDYYYNTIIQISSTNGQIPAWRILVNETSQEVLPCDSRTNSNCDTASDATARIIESLLDASNNTQFSQKEKYLELAINLTDDMLTYEFDNTCRSTDIGTICFWFKAGTQASLSGTDGQYSGYPQDIVIALLKAYYVTGNETYLNASVDTWKNYYLAAYPDGKTLSADGFRVPPGRSYRWDNLSTDPEAVCTNTCSPDRWDSADAVRAAAWGTVLFYTDEMNLTNTFPELSSYVGNWSDDYATNPTSWVFEYYANGTGSASAQNGYKAQGLQASLLMSQEVSLLNSSLRSALDHYDSTPKTWDYAPAFGIYGQSFSMNALAVAIGLDAGSYGANSSPSPDPPEYLALSITQPSNGSSYSEGAQVRIEADINSSSTLQDKYVNITYPNGTVEQNNLALVSGINYRYDFTAPELMGRYNFTVFTNNSDGLINLSTGWFNVSQSCNSNSSVILTDVSFTNGVTLEATCINATITVDAGFTADQIEEYSNRIVLTGVRYIEVVNDVRFTCTGSFTYNVQNGRLESSDFDTSGYLTCNSAPVNPEEAIIEQCRSGANAFGKSMGLLPIVVLALFILIIGGVALAASKGGDHISLAANTATTEVISVVVAVGVMVVFVVLIGAVIASVASLCLL